MLTDFLFFYFAGRLEVLEDTLEEARDHECTGQGLHSARDSEAGGVLGV